MPAVVIVLAASGATTAIGATVGAAIVGSAVSAGTAAIIGSAVVGAGVAAAQGGDANDILTSAVVGGVTAGVGSSIASSVSNSLVDAGVSSATASVAGSAVAAATVTAASGGQGKDILLSLAIPSMGNSIGSELAAKNLVSPAYSNAVGTAMASTAVQVSQGVDFETALKNATVNAIVQTGAPSVATEINKLVKIPQVSDAITSAGASALKTAAAGGSAADIERNMIGAIAGSATSSAVEYGTDGNISAGRLAGATVGGAVTGGTEGAFTGLAGEYAGQKTAEQARLTDARSKMIASADGSTLSDSGTLGNVVVTGSRETPGITDTSIITPTGRISDREVMGAMRPRPISGTLSEVTVTAPRETPDITETSIVSPDSLPEVEVKGEREEEPQAQPEEESPVDEQGRYRPNLFIYGGVKPSTLPQTLGTSVEKVPSASTTTGTSVGLGGRGEIESKESGKKRKTVWNEESLRLKDALGL